MSAFCDRCVSPVRDTHGETLPRTYALILNSRKQGALPEHQRLFRCAIACFDQALTDVGLTDDHPVRKVLDGYFTWATTNTMSRYPRSAVDVPSGLLIPKWSWGGLVGETGSDARD
jgi:hypothetical protein